jgi:ketosteroid isomerase-like protein
MNAKVRSSAVRQIQILEGSMSESVKNSATSDVALSLLSLLRAAEAGGRDEVMANFDPEAVIWHNTDEVTLTIQENFSPSVVFASKVPERRFEDVRVTPFDGGFLLQHRIVGNTDDGMPFTLVACAVIRVRNGKVLSIEEYCDSAPLKRLGIDSWLPKD